MSEAKTEQTVALANGISQTVGIWVSPILSVLIAYLLGRRHGNPSRPPPDVEDGLRSDPVCLREQIRQALRPLERRVKKLEEALGPPKESATQQPSQEGSDPSQQGRENNNSGASRDG